MKRTSRQRFALVFAVALIASSCGNSSDDAASPDLDTATTVATSDDTPDEGATTVPDEGAPGTTAGTDDDIRNTFVPIEGVPGVSDDEIAFAVIGTKANNPLGTCILDCYLDGIEAYFDYRNSEGGLFGRDLVVSEVLDDEVGANQVKSLEVISGGAAFGAFNATLVASGFGDLDAAGVPTYVWNIHATEVADRMNIFGQVAANCGDCTTRLTSYLARLDGASIVASLGYGVSEPSKVCAQTTQASFEMYLDESGVTIGYFNDDLEFGLSNGVGPQVTAMKDAGVDFIATCMDLNGMKTLAQEMQRQGMEATLYHPNTYNQTFVTEAGGIFDGDYVGVGFLPFEAEANNVAQDKFKEFMEAGGRELSELAMVGWINADTAYQSILAAGPEFDRQSSIDAMNAVTDYDADGLINPIDWTRQHSPPTQTDRTNGYTDECTAVVQIVDGVFQTLNDPATPWICWPNDTPDWSEPEAVAFG